MPTCILCHATLFHGGEIHIVFFQVMTSYSLVEYQFLAVSAAFFFGVAEGGDSLFLRNRGTRLVHTERNIIGTHYWKVHFLYRQFNIQQYCFLPTQCIYMFCVDLSEQTAIISLYNFNWLVFITETACVYCAVRTGYLY